MPSPCISVECEIGRKGKLEANTCIRVFPHPVCVCVPVRMYVCLCVYICVYVRETERGGGERLLLLLLLLLLYPECESELYPSSRPCSVTATTASAMLVPLLHACVSVDGHMPRGDI